MELDTSIEEIAPLEPTLEMARAMCREEGHIPTRIIADNGFTYEMSCSRCGETL